MTESNDPDPHLGVIAPPSLPSAPSSDYLPLSVRDASGFPGRVRMPSFSMNFTTPLMFSFLLLTLVIFHIFRFSHKRKNEFAEKTMNPQQRKYTDY